MHPDPIVLPDLEALARAEGLTGNRAGWGPCPVCGAERRGSSDPRPPLTFYAGRDGDRRWSCHAGGCEAGGDALALLAARRFGDVPARGDPRWAELFAELRAGTTAPRTGQRAPRTENGARNAKDSADLEALEVRAREAGELWAACRPVDGPGIARLAGDWLTGRRGFDLEALAPLDVVRVLPDVYPWPDWLPLMRLNLPRWLALYPLAAPVYDHRGELRALRFRMVREVRELDPATNRLRWTLAPDAGDRPKALSSKGGAAGLVLADPMGLALLRGAREVGGERWDGLVVICEGEPDLWTWATKRTRDVGTRWATFGIEAGAWTNDVAARVPDGARVVIRTHHDTAGNGYANVIRASLHPRCKVLRPTPPATDGADDDAEAT